MISKETTKMTLAVGTAAVAVARADSAEVDKALEKKAKKMGTGPIF